jgi:hypothetical protein
MWDSCPVVPPCHRRVHRWIAQGQTRTILSKDTMTSLYEAWTRQYESDQPRIFSFLYTLPFLTVTQRKALLTQVRCQTSPRTGSRLLVRDTDTRLSSINYGFRHKTQPALHSTLIQLGQSLEPFLNPFYCGFLSMAIRNAPYYDYTSIMIEKEKTIKKEVQAALHTRNTPYPFDYSSIFGKDHDSLNTRLSNNLPLRPELQYEIKGAFYRAMNSFERYVTTKDE